MLRLARNQLTGTPTENLSTIIEHCQRGGIRDVTLPADMLLQALHVPAGDISDDQAEQLPRERYRA